MDFTWSDEEKAIIEGFEKLCREKIEPRAYELDKTASLDLIRDNLKILADFGYLGAPLPEKYGGGGMKWTTYFYISEILAKSCASTYLSALAHTLLCANFIAMFGTEEQKKRFLPDLASGKKIGVLCATEPGCGSDLGALKTKAEKSKGKYIISGQKAYATNGPIGDVFVVLARVPTNGTKKHEGITAFILEKGMKGLQVGNPYDKLGVRGSPTSDVFLDSVEVPPENVIGGVEGLGFKQVMKVFDIGRVGMAVFSLGIVSACLEECIRYSRERYAFGKPIAAYEDVNFKIVDMQITVDMGRAIILKAAWMHDIGSEDAGLIASCAKLFVTERATKNASDALQIFGGLGYIKGTKVERLYRDVKLGEIGEGTSEIQRRIIFKRLQKQFGWA
ncbi:MAG: acyl-CoA dehydrogenase family protein [Candidatus Calescibacterium sp.]|jgi:alkylation response protein AidB-like acyl-CoA dehydrogenase